MGLETTGSLKFVGLPALIQSQWKTQSQGKEVETDTSGIKCPPLASTHIPTGKGSHKHTRINATYILIEAHRGGGVNELGKRFSCKEQTYAGRWSLILYNVGDLLLQITKYLFWFWRHLSAFWPHGFPYILSMGNTERLIVGIWFISVVYIVYIWWFIHL